MFFFRGSREFLMGLLFTTSIFNELTSRRALTIHVHYGPCPESVQPRRTNGWNPQRSMVWVDVFPVSRVLFQVHVSFGGESSLSHACCVSVVNRRQYTWYLIPQVWRFWITPCGSSSPRSSPNKDFVVEVSGILGRGSHPQNTGISLIPKHHRYTWICFRGEWMSLPD